VNGVLRPVTQAVMRGVRRPIPPAHAAAGGTPANPLLGVAPSRLRERQGYGLAHQATLVHPGGYLGDQHVLQLDLIGLRNVEAPAGDVHPSACWTDGLRLLQFKIARLAGLSSQQPGTANPCVLRNHTYAAGTRSGLKVAGASNAGQATTTASHRQREAHCAPGVT